MFLSILPPKTVLVAMYGWGKTRGQCAILEVEATTNQACFAILPNATWNSDFLFYWFMLSYQDLRSLSENRGSNQANLIGGLLNALTIPAPPKRTSLGELNKRFEKFALLKLLSEQEFKI
jgi:type I restriction enzyme S subunit